MKRFDRFRWSLGHLKTWPRNWHFTPILMITSTVVWLFVDYFFSRALNYFWR